MISLLMPVYNSLSGQSQTYGFLNQAIGSLQAQTYAKFELIILDNQSTDNTFEYCEKIARQDNRIKVLRDESRRSPEEAIRKLSELSKFDYCAIVNDDDTWDSRYFETLINVLESNHEISLAYTNGRYLSPSGRRLGRIDVKPNALYSASSTCETNFHNYLKFRNPFPISFGLFRRESFIESYPSKVFDSYGMNLDNIFIANFIRRGNSIIHLDSDLFFYRNKTRKLHFDRLVDTQMLTPCDVFIRLLTHQLHFSAELISSGNGYKSALSVGWANQEIILSTLEPIKHLITWIMVLYPLSYEQFNQMKRFRKLISESTPRPLLDMNSENRRAMSSETIHDYLKHLKKSSESAFGESEILLTSLNLLLSAIIQLQNLPVL